MKTKLVYCLLNVLMQQLSSFNNYCLAHIIIYKLERRPLIVWRQRKNNHQQLCPKDLSKVYVSSCQVMHASYCQNLAWLSTPEDGHSHMAHPKPRPPGRHLNAMHGDLPHVQGLHRGGPRILSTLSSRMSPHQTSLGGLLLHLAKMGSAQWLHSLLAICHFDLWFNLLSPFPKPWLKFICYNNWSLICILNTAFVCNLWVLCL